MIPYAIVSVFVIFVTVQVIQFLKRKYELSVLFKHFPSPPRQPFIGNYGLFYGKSPPEIFKKIISFHSIYGPNVVMQGLFNDTTMNVADPKDVETILLSKGSQSKAAQYQFVEPWLANGLLLAKGQQWFGQRRMITPAFHFNILEDFIEVFNKQSDKMIELLGPYAGGAKEVNMYNFVTLCALDIISETAMGVQIKAQENPNQEYVRAVQRMSDYIFERFFTFLRQFPALFPFSALARKQAKELKILHEFTTSVIIKRKEQLERESSRKTVEKAAKKKMNFLDILLHSTIDSRSLTNLEVREQVDTFMFEGHDTTTSAISFALYHLSRNDDVQQKAYEEVANLMGAQKDAVLTYDKLQEMKYLEMVIKETLRVHPSVPMIGRELSEPTEIGGVMVPAGVSITLMIYAVHHNPNVFPNPEKFDPDRFIDDYELRKNPYEYIPFSAGPRNCIGQKFAMLEMKSALAKILLNYQLVASTKYEKEEVKYKMDLVLRPLEGVHMKLIRRKN